MTNQKSSEFHTVRGYQILSQQEKKLSSAMEDYLEMTYRLCIRNNYARVGKLSELLNVKPSSASKMISKLAKLGYLEYDRYEVILLTENGREIGAYLLERHDTVEQFFKLIGKKDPLEETELVEHSLSPATVADLSTLIEFFREDLEIQQKFESFKKRKEENA